MRQLLLIIVILGILIGGGLLSTLFSQQGVTALPGVRAQTNNPTASTAVMTPDKGTVYIVFVMWVLFGLPIPPFALDYVGLLPEFLRPVMLAIPQVPGGLVPAILTLSLAVWLFNRWVNRAQRAPKTPFSFSLNPKVPNSLGSALVHRPMVTILVVVFTIATLAVVAAVAFSVFAPKPS